MGGRVSGKAVNDLARFHQIQFFPSLFFDDQGIVLIGFILGSTPGDLDLQLADLFLELDLILVEFVKVPKSAVPADKKINAPKDEYHPEPSVLGDL